MTVSSAAVLTTVGRCSIDTEMVWKVSVLKPCDTQCCSFWKCSGLNYIKVHFSSLSSPDQCYIVGGDNL